ncbi:MAG: 16S rRNA (cytosine(1402)-N(4))-methyltransferase [Chloroflexi bacterium HGW-Chloroflexi-2]|jgi:16S rRNA (cytosine1402-N4)-methyltransferase|nr:MAG: 16S rRNA (cytosine(1402)-N(4))-methyltransferase [Chloroflexi bacterium HGW-Chloroflexi-2]
MNDQNTPSPHIPVLYHEIINALAPYSGGLYIDGTLGAGGHAMGILAASDPDGKLLGIDLDPQALVIANRHLSVFKDRVFVRQGTYVDMASFVKEIGWLFVDGIILDLGVSSIQLDTKERGFSFLYDAPLDMRFGDQTSFNAADLVNSLAENDLANIIWKYGEEKYSRKIARIICQNRPINTTFELAYLVKKAYGNQYSQIHPATRTFQAIRIAVNQEMQAIESVVPQAIRLLKPGGKLAIISFHSLEDRIVKSIFRTESKDCICPPNQPICTCNHIKSIKEVNRKPIEASPEEITNNPRARSAKLRIAEKLNLA